MFIELSFVTCENVTNKANAVRAAEPIAKPFPIAAVVLPTASRLSVLFLSELFSPDSSSPNP